MQNCNSVKCTVYFIRDTREMRFNNNCNCLLYQNRQQEAYEEKQRALCYSSKRQVEVTRICTNIRVFLSVNRVLRNWPLGLVISKFSSSVCQNARDPNHFRLRRDKLNDFPRVWPSL